MKVLINSTAILSLTLYIVPPFQAVAQDLPTASVAGGAQVICLPDDQTACPDGAACVVAGAENCQSTAEATYGAPEAAAPAEPAPEAAAPEPEAAPEPAPEAAPEEAAPAAPEETAPVEVAPEAAAPEEAAPAEQTDGSAEQPADQGATEQSAEPAPEAAAPEEAAPEEAAPAEPSTEEAAPAEPAPEDAAPAEATPAEAAPEAAAPEPAAPEEAAPAEPTDQSAEQPADQGATEQSAEPAPEDAAPAEATSEAPAETATEAAPAAEPTAEPVPQALTDEQVAKQQAADQAAIEAAQKAQAEAAAAAAADPNLKPVEAPVVEEQAAQALTSVLDAPAAPEVTAEGQVAAEPAAPTAEAAAAAAIDPTVAPAEQPVPETATVTTETVTAADTRSAAQEFAAAPVQVAPGKKSGLSDLEKAGLVALGALAIGTMLKSGQNGADQRQVVQNTGDRVVVRQPDGSYVVYKDDNALLREPGSKVTTQTFQDGSTRTIVARNDGSQIATIRDASGRVLQRVAYDTKGRATVLIDDLQPEQPIIVSQLPKPRPQRIDVTAPDAAMRAALLAAQVEDYGAKYSLRQIRTIPEVRHLAPTIDVKEITFTSGSAALDPDQARSLNGLGGFIGKMIAQNPGEVFLIEGHTDAVGSAASNLTLSDRRAETVAKALTEYFGVPPENMVVQGYGESELLVPTQGDERANRRVSVRIITPILRQ